MVTDFLGKCLPVVLKNYKTKSLGYFVLYGGLYFCSMSMKEFFEYWCSCRVEVQEYLLEFFE